ncbi:TIGR01777 family oxidoreductase [Xylophilus sp. GOD-11R]|uniref:TIGR01777 family oxidoreductase n=1 Tax=Xylophilus sp. GOD-11R TaxID=3089814 RepID=UPI00298C78EB|nr:TIGR01777 family oxidoreductase [Xylophilus sp. GOD-11R]WPB56629.1 TIGR01777 family oxidoreductase [Xylophilus sp. GOD-11R]
MTLPPVLVIGATGFVGRHLVAALAADGREVIAASRNAPRARRLLGPSIRVVEDLATLPADTVLDAVVNLAGAPVIGPPWTASRRRTLLDSRLGPARSAMRLMERLSTRPRVLLAASAVGFYGAASGDSFEEHDESSPPRPGQFQSDLCAAVEQEAVRAEALGVRVVRPRFGVVLGRDGGAYPMQVPAARFGLGAVLGTGRQAAPWVHIDDVVGLLRVALQDDRLHGPVNVVAPEVPTQAAFVRTLAASFDRQVRLRLPAAPIRLLVGEMASLLLDGQNVLPRAALAAGYAFRFARLEPALRDLARPTR